MATRKLVGKETLISLCYFYGSNLNELANLFSCSITKISDILKECKVESRRTTTAKKYDCNRRFFQNIDTEYKAYFLGFMYADGYVSGNRVSLGLTGDLDILIKMKEFIHSTYPIYKYYNNYGNLSHSIVISSKEMAKDLAGAAKPPLVFSQRDESR